jgi:hypothetical protein
MDYYKLPKDKRWMRGNSNPYVIGGRSTDVSGIYYSLEKDIIYVFGKWEDIPGYIRVMLGELESTLEKAEKDIDLIIGVVSDEIAKENEQDIQN